MANRLQNNEFSPNPSRLSDEGGVDHALTEAFILHHIVRLKRSVGYPHVVRLSLLALYGRQ